MSTPRYLLKTGIQESWKPEILEKPKSCRTIQLQSSESRTSNHPEIQEPFYPILLKPKSKLSENIQASIEAKEILSIEDLLKFVSPIENRKNTKLHTQANIIKTRRLNAVSFCY